MKFYSITFYIFEDNTQVIVTKDQDNPIDDNIIFDVKNWFSEPDWYKLFRFIQFFEPRFVYVCERISV